MIIVRGEVYVGRMVYSQYKSMNKRMIESNICNS